MDELGGGLCTTYREQNFFLQEVTFLQGQG